MSREKSADPRRRSKDGKRKSKDKRRDKHTSRDKHEGALTERIKHKSKSKDKHKSKNTKRKDRPRDGDEIRDNNTSVIQHTAMPSTVPTAETSQSVERRRAVEAKLSESTVETDSEDEAWRTATFPSGVDSLTSSPAPASSNNSPPTAATFPASEGAPRRTMKHERATGTECELLTGTFADRWMTVKTLSRVEQRTGLRYVRGKFTNRERRLALQLTEEYCREHRMTLDAFHQAMFGNIGVHYRMHDFFMRGAQYYSGRPVTAFYQFLRRLLHPGNFLGFWTAEEDSQLRALVKVHGKQWEEIGREIGRTGVSCRDRYDIIKYERRNIGMWSDDEITRLNAAVAEFNSRRATSTDTSIPTVDTNITASDTNIPAVDTNISADFSDSSDLKGSAWIWISEQVRTRTPRQCLGRWRAICRLRNRALFAAIHSPNETGPAIPRRWNADDDQLLCRYLYELVVEDESEVIWDAIADVANTESDARRRFSCFVNGTDLLTHWHLIRRRTAAPGDSMDMVLSKVLDTASP